MSEANHTPGPWEYLYAGKCNEPHTVMGPASGDGSRTSIAHSAWTRPCDEANMRLIAAAPDLLAACEASLALLTKYGEGRFACAAFESERKLIHQLRTAIAKAKGRPA